MWAMELSLFPLICSPYIYILIFHKRWKRVYSTWGGMILQFTTHGLAAWFCGQLLVIGPVTRWDADSCWILVVLALTNGVLFVASRRRSR